MKNIIILLLCLLIYQISYSQRIHVEVGLKGSMSLSKDLQSTYDFGKGIVFEPNIGFLKNRLRIGPSFMLNNFRNQYSVGTITSMNMRSIGAVIAYSCVEDGKMRLLPFLKWHHTSYDDIIAPAKDYYGDVETLLTGKGSAWSGGLKVVFSAFYIEAGVQIYKPLSVASNYVINQVNNGYEIYHLYDFKPARLNLSQLYFTLGISIPDKIYIEHKAKSPSETN